MVFQTALNIFGSSDILPLTGVTIMFVSRGGTSLVAAFLFIAFFKGAEIPPKKLKYSEPAVSYEGGGKH